MTRMNGAPPPPEALSQRRWMATFTRGLMTIVFVAAALPAVISGMGCRDSSQGWAFAVGEMAPDFTVVSPDGPWSLGESHGRARLVVFCASWCPPCRMEMSDITRHLLPRLSNQDTMDVVMILIDASESSVDRMARTMGASGPVYADPGGREYHRLARGGIPRSMVVMPKAV